MVTDEQINDFIDNEIKLKLDKHIDRNKQCFTDQDAVDIKLESIDIENTEPGRLNAILTFIGKGGVTHTSFSMISESYTLYSFFNNPDLQLPKDYPDDIHFTNDTPLFKFIIRCIQKDSLITNIKSKGAVDVIHSLSAEKFIQYLKQLFTNSRYQEEHNIEFSNQVSAINSTTSFPFITGSDHGTYHDIIDETLAFRMENYINAKLAFYVRNHYTSIKLSDFNIILATVSIPSGIDDDGIIIFFNIKRYFKKQNGWKIEFESLSENDTFELVPQGTESYRHIKIHGNMPNYGYTYGKYCLIDSRSFKFIEKCIEKNGRREGFASITETIEYLKGLANDPKCQEEYEVYKKEMEIISKSQAIRPTTEWSNTKKEDIEGAIQKTTKYRGLKISSKSPTVFNQNNTYLSPYQKNDSFPALSAVNYNDMPTALIISAIFGVIIIPAILFLVIRYCYENSTRNQGSRLSTITEEESRILQSPQDEEPSIQIANPNLDASQAQYATTSL